MFLCSLVCFSLSKSSFSNISFYFWNIANLSIFFSWIPSSIYRYSLTTKEPLYWWLILMRSKSLKSLRLVIYSLKYRKAARDALNALQSHSIRCSVPRHYRHCSFGVNEQVLNIGYMGGFTVAQGGKILTHNVLSLFLYIIIIINLILILL